VSVLLRRGLVPAVLCFGVLRLLRRHEGVVQRLFGPRAGRVRRGPVPVPVSGPRRRCVRLPKNWRRIRFFAPPRFVRVHHVRVHQQNRQFHFWVDCAAAPLFFIHHQHQGVLFEHGNTICNQLHFWGVTRWREFLSRNSLARVLIASLRAQTKLAPASYTPKK